MVFGKAVFGQALVLFVLFFLLSVASASRAVETANSSLVSQFLPPVSCPWTVAATAATCVATGYEMGLTTQTIARIEASSYRADAEIYYATYVWLQQRNPAFFSLAAELLTVPYYSRHDFGIQGTDLTIRVSREVARTRMFDGLLREFNLSIHESARDLLVATLTEYPDVSYDEMIKIEEIRKRVANFARFRLGRDAGLLVDWLARKGVGKGRPKVVRELIRNDDPVVTHFLTTIIDRYLSLYRGLVSGPQNIIRRALDQTIDSFVELLRYREPGARNFIYRLLEEAFLTDYQRTVNAKELREHWLEDLRMDIKHLGEMHPEPAPPPAKVEAPRIVALSASKGPPSGLPGESRRRAKRATAQAEAAAVDFAEGTESLEVGFASDCEQRKLSDAHHAAFMRWFDGQTKKVKDYVAGTLGHIFHSPIAEWRHTKPLGDHLHELKFDDSLKRIFFWAGKGGLRLVKAHDDPKHDRAYEIEDYHDLRAEIRANVGR